MASSKGPGGDSCGATGGSAGLRWYEMVAGSFVRGRREKVTARETSRDVLRLYERIKVDQPGLSRLELYQLVVARHTGGTDHDARRTIDIAQDSFASWPVERDLTLRDVTQCLIVQHCREDAPHVVGIEASVRAIVAQEIPSEA